VLGLDHDPNASGLQDLLDRFANFGRELLLDLQAPRKPLNNAGELRYPDNAVFGQITDVGAP
jgi:hypothetical protein